MRKEDNTTRPNLQYQEQREPTRKFEESKQQNQPLKQSKGEENSNNSIGGSKKNSNYPPIPSQVFIDQIPIADLATSGVDVPGVDCSHNTDDKNSISTPAGNTQKRLLPTYPTTTNKSKNDHSSPNIVAPDSPISDTGRRVLNPSGTREGNPNSESNSTKEELGGNRSHGFRPFSSEGTENMVVDDSFSQALLNLSFNDRNAIHEEIHGVSCMAPDEDAPGFHQLRAQVLYAMNIELNSIQQKPAFDRAQEMHRAAQGGNSATSSIAYVNTDAFRLGFLRCELFDPKKAAQRMVTYLELVNKIYGPDALMRPIRLSDFSRDDMAFLRGGDYQLLPYRDRSGRRILCIVTNNRDDISDMVRTKVLMYLWVVAAEDVESQRKGMIVISYSGPQITKSASEEDASSNVKQQKFHASRVTTHAVVGQAVPMRVVAIHFCLPNKPIFAVFSRIYGMSLGAWSSRVSFHLGEGIEIRYKLKSYGIPIELIPSTDTGNVKHVNLKQWIKLREFLERYQASGGNGAQCSFGQTFGQISSDSEDAMDIEYSVGGNTQAMKQYLQMQQNQLNQVQQQQQQRQQPSHQLTLPRFFIVECPGSNDVIFRRGKSMIYHPGNAMFQSLIESRLEAHTKANQSGKVAIVAELIHTIRGIKGGRFLTWDSKHSWWQDMTIPTFTFTSAQAQESEIQSKVNYAFRDFKKKMKTQQNLQISRSSTYAFERQDGIQRKRFKSGSVDRDASGGCGEFGCGGNNTSAHNLISDGGEY